MDGEPDLGDRCHLGTRSAGSSRCAGSILDAAAVEWRVTNGRPLQERMVRLARTEPDAEVRSELANAAGRFQAHEDAGNTAGVDRARRGRSGPAHSAASLVDARRRPSPATRTGSSAGSRNPAVWQGPLFTEHLAGRVARRLAADRGDTPAFRRKDPDTNWKLYAEHPRVLMPGGKGDYTDWETNDTPEISRRTWRAWCGCWRCQRPRLTASGCSPASPPDSSRARLPGRCPSVCWR